MRKVLFLLCVFSFIVQLVGDDSVAVTYLLIIAPESVYKTAKFTTLCEAVAKWENDKASVDSVTSEQVLKVKNYFVKDVVYNENNPSENYYIASIPLYDLTGLTKDGKEVTLAPTTKNSLESYVAGSSGCIIKIVKGKNIEDLIKGLGFKIKPSVWLR